VPAEVPAALKEASTARPAAQALPLEGALRAMIEVSAAQRQESDVMERTFQGRGGGWS
jgi:hypothetical protein